jgi:hypothetical protein
MNASQTSSPINETVRPELQDEFATGHENRLRRSASRFVSWLFHPPYFPNSLTWFLLAVIASNSAIELLSQPAGYWADAGVAQYNTFLWTPLSWGVWSIGIYIGYLILIGLLLSLVNLKPAFALWIALTVLHFSNIAGWLQCGSLLHTRFITPDNCSEVYTAWIMLAGILWGMALLAAAQFGLISWLAPAEAVVPRWATRLRTASMGWIGLLVFSVTLSAMSPTTSWRRVEPAHVPTGRSSASLAYDSGRAVAVLFGGTTGWTQNTGWESVNDTWEWDGNDWTEIHPQHNLTARYAAGMVFDEKRGITVLFGGSGQDENYQPVFHGDTWEWNGEDWLEVSTTFGPPARQAPSMFYDPLRETVVMYGGYAIDPYTWENIFLDDAWEWDGKAWRQIAFDQPRRNSASVIVFDPIRQLPLLMDGEGLWFWQEALWVQPNYSTSPSGRWGSQMVFDPANQQLVLYGGYKDTDVFEDTWVYDGRTWQQIITKSPPPARNGHNLFFDQTRRRVMLFGGLNGLTFYNDMWELTQP